MDKLFKIKSGAIIKIVPQGSLEWYLMANWKLLGEVKNENKTNTKRTTSK